MPGLQSSSFLLSLSSGHFRLAASSSAFRLAASSSAFDHASGVLATASSSAFHGASYSCCCCYCCTPGPCRGARYLWRCSASLRFLRHSKSRRDPCLSPRHREGGEHAQHHPLHSPVPPGHARPPASTPLSISCSGNLTPRASSNSTPAHRHGYAIKAKR